MRLPWGYSTSNFHIDENGKAYVTVRVSRLRALQLYAVALLNIIRGVTPKA
jgi:hypothetical protein